MPIAGSPILSQAMWPRPLPMMAAVTLSLKVGARRFLKKKSALQDGGLLITCLVASSDWLSGLSRGGAAAGSCGLLFAGTSRRAPARPLLPSARPRRFECCESNVGFVTFRWRCGQFLKGQPRAAAQTWPRPAPPPAPGGPGRREADRAWASRGRRRGRTKRGPRQETDSPRTGGRGGEHIVPQGGGS